MRTGEKNSRHKMTWPDVREARMLYRHFKERKRNSILNGTAKPGTMSTYVMAEEYGVSQSTMWNLLHRKTWK